MGAVPRAWQPDAVPGTWEWELWVEDRSLDRLIEMTRRGTAAARAVLDIKARLIAAGLRIRLTSSEHAMVAVDFEDWARTERDPKKAAELASLGRLSRHLCRAAVERENAAKKAKRPARKRRPRA